MKLFNSKKVKNFGKFVFFCMLTGFSFSASAFDLASPTRGDDPVIPPENVDPIRNEWVMNGYICQIDPGARLDSTMTVQIHSEPECLNTLIGFVAICSRTVGLSCPSEDNSAKYGYLYEPEMKPALIQALEQHMLAGKRVEVYRLSNTLDYPHYEGPLLYGNKVIFLNKL